MTKEQVMADGPSKVEQLKRQLKERDETNRCLAARIAELEAALEGDAGNVIYFAEQQALDRAAEEAQEHDCGFRGHELCDCRSKIAAAIRELKEPADGNNRNG
jgi:hypothetical protein